MPTRIRNISSIVLVTLLGILLLAPGLKLLKFDGKTLSAGENRKLTALPGLPKRANELVHWPQQFENFVADHFGFRSALVRVYNLIHVKAGVSPIRRVLVGKAGWLFLEQARLADSYRGALPLSPGRLARLVDSFELRNHYLAARQKRLIVLPLPDKDSIYPEFLPDSVKIIGPSRFIQFLDASAKAAFPSVDSLSVLAAAKQRGEAIYFQTDSHWNCRGAWFAYLALMQKIRETGYRGGRILQASEVDFIRSESPRGGDLVRNLLNLEGLVAEHDAYRCRVRNPAEIEAIRPSDGRSFDYVWAAPPGKEHRKYKHVQARDHSRVLVYRDSYANALLPFLISSFDEVIYAAPKVHMGFDPADVDRYDPDLVIYEFVERGLSYPPDDTLLLAGIRSSTRSSNTADLRDLPGNQ